MKDILGGKGSGLAEMSRAGIPVPPGFTISTEVCNLYFQGGNKVPHEINQQIEEALGQLEASVGKRLGDPENPLLVSVRISARGAGQRIEGINEIHPLEWRFAVAIAVVRKADAREKGPAGHVIGKNAGFYPIVPKLLDAVLELLALFQPDTQMREIGLTPGQCGGPVAAIG